MQINAHPPLALIILLSLACLLFFAASCSHQATAPAGHWVYSPMPVDSISVGQVDSSSAAFIAKAWWGDGCGQFSHYVLANDGNACKVTIIGKEYVEPDKACIQICMRYNVPVSVPLPGPGTYTFKFWRTDGSTLDTTLTIP